MNRPFEHVPVGEGGKPGLRSCPGKCLASCQLALRHRGLFKSLSQGHLRVTSAEHLRRKRFPPAAQLCGRPAGLLVPRELSLDKRLPGLAQHISDESGVRSRYTDPRAFAFSSSSVIPAPGQP